MLAHVSLLGYLLRKARWAIKMAAMFQYGGHPQHKNPLIGLAVLIRDMRGAWALTMMCVHVSYNQRDEHRVQTNISPAKQLLIAAYFRYVMFHFSRSVFLLEEHAFNDPMISNWHRGHDSSDSRVITTSNVLPRSCVAPVTRCIKPADPRRYSNVCALWIPNAKFLQIYFNCYNMFYWLVQHWFSVDIM